MELVIVDLGNGCMRITCPGDKAMDERPGRKYRKVECRERDSWHFVGV